MASIKYLVDLDLGGNELQNAVLQTVANPTGGIAGQIVYDTASKFVMISDGTSYSRVGSIADGTTIEDNNGTLSVKSGVYALAAHGHSISDITNLQTALDDKVDDSQVLTNVPAGAVFTDTTYSAGNGISLTGTTFSVVAGDGLTQEASGLKVDDTVVRTSGDQVIAGGKRFSDDLRVDGDLIVAGTTTTVNSTEVSIGDALITLASTATAPAEISVAGIEINRGTGQNKPTIYYEEAAGRWFFTGSDGNPHVISLEGEFDTNTQLSTEQVQDIIGAMVSGNTETNISVTYDDTNGKLNFVSTNTQRTDEEIRDVIGATIVGSGATTVTVNDAANTITVSSTDTNTTYSAGNGLSLSGTTFNNDHYIGLVTVAGTGGFVPVDCTMCIPQSVALQVKENGANFTHVITDWYVQPDGVAQVFLPAGRDYHITFTGLAL